MALRKFGLLAHPLRKWVKGYSVVASRFSIGGLGGALEGS